MIVFSGWFRSSSIQRPPPNGSRLSLTSWRTTNLILKVGERLRARLGKLYPAEVRLVADQGDLHSNLLGAHVAIVESFPIEEKEILAAGGSVQIVQKYGTIATRIDVAACQRLGVRLLTIRRRANI